MSAQYVVNGQTVNPGDVFKSGTEVSPDYYASYMQGQADTVWSKIEDMFTGAGNAAAAASAKTAADRAYEQQATQSARAWDEYMQSTQFQRMVKDLEAAGLNPWLALQGSSLSGAHQTTAGSGSSARYQKEEYKKGSTSTIVAALLVACARIAAAAIAA